MTLKDVVKKQLQVLSESLNLDAIRELKIFIDNDESLHVMKLGILKELSFDKAKDKFDEKKAEIRMQNLVSQALEAYKEKYGEAGKDHRFVFNTKTLEGLVDKLIKEFLVSYDNKEYDFMKGYQRPKGGAKPGAVSDTSLAGPETPTTIPANPIDSSVPA